MEPDWGCWFFLLVYLDSKLSLKLSSMEGIKISFEQFYYEIYCGYDFLSIKFPS